MSKNNQCRLCTLLLLLINISLFGQTLVGELLDPNKGPVSEAVVLNLSTNNFAISNEEGFFRFNDLKEGDTIQVIHIGFINTEVVIDDIQEPLQISLETKAVSLEEVVISRKVNPLKILSDIDLNINPVNSSTEILRIIPGLFIGQHAGGGKAEQIFLRGFDIDHGTDITLSVDGIPVNMVSHAHGQGYSDLHFLIPETIKNIDFGKGPYFEDKGNFNTAGYVNFKTKDFLKDNLVKVELGQFNTQRLLAMGNLVKNTNHKAYVATEYLASDGPFENPQNLQRFNLFGKYQYAPNNSTQISAHASFFSSSWDASGQIPQRLVDNGTIDRFGAIDPTEGGNTQRINALVEYRKIFDNNASFKNRFFYSNYNFDLFSNFTFFLEDPVLGDQIRQRELRNIWGFDNVYTKSLEISDSNVDIKIGTSLRSDHVKDNELSRSIERMPIDTSRFGNINELNVGSFLSLHVYKNDFVINAAVRMDYFSFNYQDALLGNSPFQSVDQVVVSPKVNFIYNPSRDLQLYLKYGKGFHSNDSRVVTNGTTNNIIPAAHGFDVGSVWKPFPKVVINAAYWYLFLEQEFVYVGDAGIVEPSGKTQRNGFDLNLRYEIFDWLFWKLDATNSFAESIEEEEGQNFIPLAPKFTLINGLDFAFPSGIYGSVQLRHLNDRPANEDNSIQAIGYTLVDLNVGYRVKKFDLGVQVQNLFNSEWNEAQFATLSQLSGESQAIEEIHFTPGTPFFVKTVLSYTF